METRYLDAADGVRIAYVDEPGDGPPLVFVHGWCSNLRHWDKQAAHFSGRRRMLRSDRRGHGASSAPDSGYDPETVADDIAVLARHFGVYDAVVIGHAGAGAATLTLARKHPDIVAKVVLVEARLHGSLDEMREAGDPFAALLEELRAGMEADFAATLEGAYRSFFDPRSPADTVGAAVADALRTPRHAAVSDMLNNIGAGTLGVARLVEQHVHWIHAVDSQISNPDLAARTFRSVTIHPIPQGGHFVHMEAPHAVNVALEACLARV